VGEECWGGGMGCVEGGDEFGVGLGLCLGWSGVLLAGCGVGKGVVAALGRCGRENSLAGRGRGGMG
jgi:hypothetical protein